MGKPRLPWKRGPVAFEIALRAEVIKARLADHPRSFLSLRETSKILGISTQPVRDWVRLGHLKREGPRSQFARTELERFVGWLEERAERFDSSNYLERIQRHRTVPMPWHKLATAQFKWPKGRDLLTPSELAALIGCHPSLILKAIAAGQVNAHRRTRCRWGISRRDWRRAFPSDF